MRTYYWVGRASRDTWMFIHSATQPVFDAAEREFCQSPGAKGDFAALRMYRKSADLFDAGSLRVGWMIQLQARASEPFLPETLAQATRASKTSMTRRRRPARE